MRYLKTAAVFAICLVAAFACGCVNEYAGSIYIEHGDDAMTVVSPAGNVEIRYSYIEGVTYIRDWEPGTLVEGVETDYIKCGTYDKDGVQYQLHMYAKASGVVVVEYINGTLVFNLEDNAALIKEKDRIAKEAFGTEGNPA